MDNDAEILRLRAEVAALRKALGEVMPLLAECDCIDSDRTDMLCPCKAARAALADKPLSGPTRFTDGRGNDITHLVEKP